MKTEKQTYSQKIDTHRALYTGDQDNPIEYRKMMEKEVLANLNDAFAKAVVHPKYKDKNFYVELRISTESVKGTVRTKPFVLLACPSARFGSSVWKYHHESGNIEYLWSIPGQKDYYYIINNTNEYLNNGGIPDTAKFAHMLKDGTLLKLIQKENGYKKDGLIILKETTSV